MKKYDLPQLRVALGRKLYSARIEANMSQRQVEDAGIEYQSKLSKMENGELLPNIFKLVDLAKLYGKDLEYFIDNNHE